MDEIYPVKMSHVACPTTRQTIPYGEPAGTGISYGSHRFPEGMGVLVAISTDDGAPISATMNPAKAIEFAERLLKCAKKAARSNFQ